MTASVTERVRMEAGRLFEEYRQEDLPETGKPPSAMNLRYQKYFIRFLEEKYEGRMVFSADLMNEYKDWLLEGKNRLGMDHSVEWIVQNFVRLRLFFKWLAARGELKRNPLEAFEEGRMRESLKAFQECRRRDRMVLKIGTLSGDEVAAEFLKQIREYVQERYYEEIKALLHELKAWCAFNRKALTEVRREDLKPLIHEWFRKEIRSSLRLTDKGVLGRCYGVRYFFKWLYDAGYTRENRFQEYREPQFMELIREARKEEEGERKLKERQYSVREILKAYNKHLKASYAGYGQYRKMYRYFTDFLRYVLDKGSGLYRADEGLIEEYKAYLFEYEYRPGQGYTGWVQAERVEGVKRFYDWFTENRYTANHPLKSYGVRRYAASLEGRERIKTDREIWKRKQIPEEFRGIYERMMELEKTKRWSAGTQARHEKGYRSFLMWLEKRGVRDIREADEGILDDYQIYLCGLREEGMTSLLIRENMVAVKNLFRYLARTMEMPRDISLFMELPKREQGLPTCGMTNREAIKLMDQVKTGQKHRIRNRAILETLYSTGARVNELRHIRFGDVDFGYGYVRINEAKGGLNRQRVVPIGKAALESIREYLNHSGRRYEKNDFLFLSERGVKMSKSNILNIIKTCALKGGLKRRIVTHSFRVTCATEMLRNRADIKYVQQQLGHVSIQTTEKYLRLMPGDLKKVHEKCHPRERNEKLSKPY